MVTKAAYAHGEFSWVDLPSHGMARAGTFYSEVFGWKVVDQDTAGGPPFAQFEITGGAIAGLGLNDDTKAMGIPPAWNSYINVDDIEAVTSKAADLGATITVPVMQIMDAGTLSFIDDPDGSNVAFWQKGTHHGAARVDESGCFCWNELATRDIEKSREFYTALLGWECVDYPGLPTKYYIAKAGGEDVGGLVQMTEDSGEIRSGWGVYFAVDDADTTVARVKTAGGSVRAEPFDSPVGKIAVFADPQGAVFSVLHKTASC